MLDTMGSYIIGGIVLVIMTAVILNMQDSSRQAVFNEISQFSLAEMSQTMEREMTNMGYRVEDGQKIVSMSYRSISFLSDHDNDGAVDTISYTMQRTRSGPVITRVIARPGEKPLRWTTRGSMVLFTGYDENGAVTFDPARIRAVEASMLTSNILYDRYSALTSTSSGTTASGTSLEGTVTTAEENLVVNHNTLLTTAVDCQAGAYWHKVIYPRNLTVEAPQIGGADEDWAGGTATGDTDTGSTGTGITDPTGGDTGSGDTGTGDAGDTGGGDTGTTDPGDTDSGGTITPPGGGGEGEIGPPKNKNDPCPCGSGLRYKDCHGK